MTTPSLRQLDIFAQLAASGNMVRCAVGLGLSEEQVRRDIRSLEMRLGYRLFAEEGDDVRLTAAGRRTAEALTLLDMDEPPAPPSPREERLAPTAPARKAIMLAAPAPVFGHLQEALAAFEEANDDIAITLDLTVQTAEEASTALRRNRADIAYFYTLGEPPFPSRYAWSEQISLYAGADHPVARLDSVSRRDLAITPRLAMDRSNGLRRIIDAALEQGGLDAPPPVLETDTLFDIVDALRNGAGTFAAFGPMGRDLGRMAGVRRLALDSPFPPVTVRQAMRPGLEDDAPAHALADYLFL
ncbi:LysR family transcriptional regulator [Sphingobium ummariense]|uniref:HTH lysR-type domain-containing protein n=1 Tax=Sphingobium ummariense RL-3 TaxID=1346791 RepID=T0J216_9SPHN|nr:LysR family transcriptional regulator [Sphingobium ummariense]EQB32001.1 hypothetical protein M529_11695 [Sphingobium ummariense RL-3]